MKLLIIRFSSIGDIVLTSPVIRCLRQQYPEATIHFLVKKAFGSVIRHNPHIDQVHEFDGALRPLTSRLKAEQYDLIIDLQKNHRSKKIARILGLPRLSFPKLNFRKWLYVNLKWNVMPDKSIVSRYFKAVRPLQVRPDGRGLEFHIPESMATRQQDIPAGHWAGYAAFVIGGSFATKQFPAAKWKQLCSHCPFPIILLGGPDDQQDGETIADAAPGKVYNACGKFSLIESADLVRKSRVVVTNDTGLMHIAAAFQKPVISLWGNTTPDMGMFPYFGQNNLHDRPDPRSVCMEVKPLSCRPCSKLGYGRCPKKHFRCMNDISMETTTRHIIRYWRQN